MSDIYELQKKLLTVLVDFDRFCTENNIIYSLDGGNLIGAIRHKGFIPWDDDIDVQMDRENYNRFKSLYQNNEKYTLQKDTIDYPLQFSKLRANNTTFIEDIKYRKKYKNIHQGIFIDIFPVDKVSEKKLSASLQVIFSNILISQSLFLRGISYNHTTSKKLLFIYISLVFLPFRKLMLKYVSKFNTSAKAKYFCSFYGGAKKIYQSIDNYIPPLDRLPYETFEFPVIKNYEKYLTDLYGDFMKIPSMEEIQYKIHAIKFDINKDYTAYLN